MNEPMQQTVNPIEIMNDEELISRFKLADLESVEFKNLRQELLYRLRKARPESWTPPKRHAPTKHTESMGVRRDET